MSKQRQKRKPAPARFKVGDRVWVRHGIMDTEYPDMPLGGWVGTIAEVHRRGMYTVHWSRETLAAIHPVYKKRCERDGMMLEEYWLADNDLEPDPGGPLSIEHPKEITPRPLSTKNQDDRVRMVFGLTSDDLLPRPNEDSLETYYDYLGERLSFPFEARCHEEDNPFIPSPVRCVQVVTLGKEPHDLDEEDGIFCEVQSADGEQLLPLANLELRRSDRNRQLVNDYAAWFLGELAYEGDEYDGEDEDGFNDDDESDEEPFCVAEKVTWRGAALLLAEVVAFATCYGAVVGSALAAMPWTLWGACMGASVCGMFVAIAQAAYARREMRRIMPNCSAFIAGLVGLAVGVVQGTFFGIAATAFVGPVLGGLLGAYSRRFLDNKKWLSSRSCQLVNYADIARSLSIPQTTLKRYITLMEMTFLVQLLPAWFTNIGKRLAKSPKLLLADTGLLVHLLGVDAVGLRGDRTRLGHVLENRHVSARFVARCTSVRSSATPATLPHQLSLGPNTPVTKLVERCAVPK